MRWVDGVDAEAAVTDFIDIAGGVFIIASYTPETLTKAIGSLDLEAAMDLVPCTGLIENIEAGEKLRCVFCRKLFTSRFMPHRITVIRPSIDVIQAALNGGSTKGTVPMILHGVCLKCETPDIQERLVAHLRDRCFPDLRILNVGRAGHA